MSADGRRTRDQRKELELLLRKLSTGARTLSLYAEGHSAIPQVVDRTFEVFRSTLAEIPELAVEIRARTLVLDDVEVAASDEIEFLASSLHQLGVGRLVLTRQVDRDGLQELLRLVVAKPGPTQTLPELQKVVQETEIEGLELTSVLDFMVKAEEERSRPEDLTEEQVEGIAEASSIPDLVLLLRARAETFGAEDRSIAELLDRLADREVDRDGFASALPWNRFDDRIRARWDALVAGLEGADEDGVDRLALADEADLRWARETVPLDPETAAAATLGRAHALLANPSTGLEHLEESLDAYACLVAEVAKAGDLGRLLEEVPLWTRMAGDDRWEAAWTVLEIELQERVPSEALAAGIVGQLGSIQAGFEEFRILEDLVTCLGQPMVSLLLPDLRKLAERSSGPKLAKLLAAATGKLGSGVLAGELAGEAPDRTAAALAVIAEQGLPESARLVTPHLRSPHREVRAAAFRGLRRMATDPAADALVSYIRQGKKADVEEAIDALARMKKAGVETKLIGAFEKIEDADTRIAIVSGLARIPTQETRDFLESLGKKGALLGRNKALRLAAHKSLDQIKRGATAVGDER